MVENCFSLDMALKLMLLVRDTLSNYCSTGNHFCKCGSVRPRIAPVDHANISGGMDVHMTNMRLDGQLPEEDLHKVLDRHYL
jgi:hypothetical protein